MTQKKLNITHPAFDPKLPFQEIDEFRFQGHTTYELNDKNKWVPVLLMTDPEKWLTQATIKIKRGLDGYGSPER
jgi:hypothetical protein